MIRLSPSLSAPALTLGLLLALVPALGCSTGEAPPSIENATGPVSATPPAEESAGAAEAGTAGGDGVLADVATRDPDDAPTRSSTIHGAAHVGAVDPSPGDAAAPAPTLSEPMTNNDQVETPSEEVATLGAGCFWCIEAVLEQVEGVKSVESGYMGGETLDPTYKDICTGRTGHAEVVKVTFDPSALSYAELLDWFWRLHDPTTLNRQGNDRGTQYRSAIFFHSDEQRKIAETSKRDVQPTFSDPIVTEVSAAATFYPAEKYHQGYYFDNTSQGYCQMVIAPKLKKLGLKY